MVEEKGLKNLEKELDEDVTHFKLGIYSEANSLGGINAGVVAEVDKGVKYGLNAGFFSFADDGFNYGLNMGFAAAVDDGLNYGANIGVFIGIVMKEMKRGLNVGMMAWNEEMMKDSVNVGVFSGANKMERALIAGIGTNVIGNMRNGVSVGIFTIAENEMENSCSIGALNLAEKLVKSLELGFVNYAEENLGYQVGLVNICERKEGEVDGKKKKGRMIGLLNIDKSKPWYKGVSFLLG
jgi:hypothetical protein